MLNISNPCHRCGQERIISKTWKEKVKSYFGESVIIHTETVCPDKECQKIVNEKNIEAKKKIENLQLEKEKRLVEAKKKLKANLKYAVKTSKTSTKKKR